MENNINDLFEDYLTSPESLKEFSKMEDLRKRNIDYLLNLGKEGRLELFQKIHQKYESKEYQDRELNLGYEPRTPLYDVILDYAVEYGVSLRDVNPYFPESKYIIDGVWEISITYGQGVIIRLTKTPEEDFKL